MPILRKQAKEVDNCLRVLINNPSSFKQIEVNNYLFLIIFLMLAIFPVLCAYVTWYYYGEEQAILLAHNANSQITSVYGKSNYSNKYNNNDLLLTIESRGGLCPQGTCSIEKSVYNSKDTKKLEILINSANYNEIRTKKFTGLCPTAYDGQEAIYIFYTKHGNEKVSSCDTAIDYNSELFIEVEKALQNLSSSYQSPS